MLPIGSFGRWVLQQGSVETGSVIACCHSVTGQIEKQKKTARKRRGERRRRRRYLANDIIATELVLVHDSDNYSGVPQHMGRHVKGEGLVENGVQAALHYHCLLLFHALVLVHQPHFNIGICRERKAPRLHKTPLIIIRAAINISCAEPFCSEGATLYEKV